MASVVRRRQRLSVPTPRTVKLRMWLALGLLAAAAVWFGAPKLHRFAYWIDRKTDADVRALATGRWQARRLEVEPGIELAGLVRPPVAGGDRWVLFVPGNSTALLAGFQQELERCVPDDRGVMLFAYRGFEASDGVPTPAALLSDLERQWETLQALGATPQRTEVFGYSLGAVLAVQLVARLGERGQAPARLVLAAAGERIAIMPHGALGRFSPDDVYDAAAAAPGVRCPTVIVHGTADDALPIGSARALRARLGGEAVLHEVEGAGHTDVWHGVRQHAFR